MTRPCGWASPPASSWLLGPRSSGRSGCDCARSTRATSWLSTPVFFFKQKTAYEIGLGIPAEPLFRSIILLLHFLSLMLGSVLVLMLPLLVWLTPDLRIKKSLLKCNWTIRKRLPRCKMRLKKRLLAFSRRLHARIRKTRY